MSKQQNEFSQHWKQKQITERKMTERQKLLLEIERLNKEIIKLKEVIENKNAHVESKNKHIARLEKVISIMKKGEPTIFWFFPKGALSHWVQWVRFCPAKLSVTWQSRGIFLCIPFLAIVVQSVTTEVVTLCTTVMIISPPIRDGSATPEKN